MAPTPPAGSSRPPVPPSPPLPAALAAPLRLLGALARGLALVEGAGIALCLVALVGLATWQFVDRNLTQRHLPSWHVPIWTDGVLRHAVFLLGFLGGAYATFAGRHIRIDAVTRLLGPRARLALRVVTGLAAMAVVVVLVRAGIGFREVTLEESGEASQAEQLFTPARGALALVLGYAVIALHLAVQILFDLGWLLAREAPPGDWVAEAAHGEAGAADAPEAQAAAGPGPG